MSSEARPTGPGTSTGGDSGNRDPAEHPGAHTGSARRIVVNTLYRAAGEGTAKLASFALFLIAARRLGTGGFGEITFALSLATALFVLSGLGTDGLLAREVARDRSTLHGFMGNILLLKLATSAVLMVAAVAIGFAWSASSEARIAVVLISASAAIENIGRTWTSAFQAYERMGYTSAALILQRSLTAAAGIAVLLAGGGVVAVSAVFLIGSIAGLAFLVIMLPRALGRLAWSVDVRRLVPLFRVALPIGIAGLFFTILMRVDTVILGLIERDNPDEVGLYGAAFRLCEATMFLSWSLGSAIYPWFSRQRADETAALSRGYELSLLALALILTPIGLIFALLASPLVRLLYGDEYLGATASLRLLGVVVVAYGLNYMTATTLTAHDRPGLFTRLLPTVAVLNVALSLALIPSLGATGAALAAAVSGAVLAVLGMWQTRSVLGGIRLLRILAVPAIAGIGMTAAVLLTPGGLVVQLVVGVVAFALAAAAALRIVTPAEFDLLRSARRGIRGAGRGRETP